jgi:hypothetical protein
LCTPDASACSGTKTCVTDPANLEAVGLPTDQGFGVCGQ